MNQVKSYAQQCEQLVQRQQTVEAITTFLETEN